MDTLAVLTQAAAIDATLDAASPVADSVELARILTTTLPERGLDRLTPKAIENQLCTSALTAHI